MAITLYGAQNMDQTKALFKKVVTKSRVIPLLTYDTIEEILTESRLRNVEGFKQAMIKRAITHAEYCKDSVDKLSVTDTQKGLLKRLVDEEIEFMFEITGKPDAEDSEPKGFFSKLFGW